MKSLILAEKPSVARNIAKSVGATQRRKGYLEGQNYIVTWAYGHLLTLFDMPDYDPKFTKWSEEDLPYYPNPFKYKVNSSGKADDPVSDQVKIIKGLIARNDVSSVISATDNDREGQLIGDLLFRHLKVKKPIYRLLINEWTDENIKKGLANLVANNEMNGLMQAGLCHHFADWLIGINLSRLATLRFGRGIKGPVRIGRVINPTLKIVYDRDKAIAEFVPEAFFKLNGTFSKDGQSYSGAYKDEEGNERFSDKKDAEALLKALEGKGAFVRSVEKTERRQYPEALFNQTNLQGKITSEYPEWTADKVLAVAQKLYERGFLTYPRTASRALEEGSAQAAEELLNVLKASVDEKGLTSFEVTKRVFDNDKVDSHSAIIPTKQLPRPGDLNEDEEILYTVVRDRFLEQFMPPAVFEATKLITDVDGRGFHSSGKTLKDPGFLAYRGGVTDDKLLPNVSEGDAVDVAALEVAQGSTTAPKALMEKDLLRIMESCGKTYKDEDEEAKAILSGFSIGTDATRAPTIAKLVDCGYLERDKKYIHVTDLGRNLVEAFPVKELFDLEFTGRLEYQLKQLEKGNADAASIMESIKGFVGDSSAELKQAQRRAIKPEEFSPYKCPVCGASLKEFDWGFGCSAFRSQGCSFKVPYKIAGKKLTELQMKRLLEKGKTGNMKGFVSKKGNKFECALEIRDGKVVFVFPERKKA